MNYILLQWSYGRKSMEAVVEKMTEPCHLVAKKKSGEWVEYSPETQEWAPLDSIMSILRDDSSRIINWGNRIFSNDEYFDINVPSAIYKASNKSLSRKILQNLGVAVPRTYWNTRLNDYREFPYPLIVRPFQHYGGSNFNVFNSFEELAPFLWGKNMEHWYVSELFEKTHEFRVHCAHGKVLLINEKPLVEGEIRANHVVNHESWRALKWSEFNEKICKESLKATAALGLDYSAVDVMYNAASDSVAICEVNTSPSVTTEYSSGKYAAYFSWVIRNEFPTHFPREGKSVFYNKILES